MQATKQEPAPPPVAVVPAAKKQFLTIDKLVERWHGAVSRQTLANWRIQKEGRVGPDYIKLGGKILYDVADVEKFEAQQTVRRKRAA